MLAESLKYTRLLTSYITHKNPEEIFQDARALSSKIRFYEIKDFLADQTAAGCVATTASILAKKIKHYVQTKLVFQFKNF